MDSSWVGGISIKTRISPSEYEIQSHLDLLKNVSQNEYAWPIDFGQPAVVLSLLKTQPALTLIVNIKKVLNWVCPNIL